MGINSAEGKILAEECESSASTCWTNAEGNMPAGNSSATRCPEEDHPDRLVVAGSEWGDYFQVSSAIDVASLDWA